MKRNIRKIDLVVLSDIHLGTYGCQARELNKYLKSIHPKTLVLNGDIIDIWQFSKRYWPKSHMKVVRQLFNLATRGTRIYYLTGNHDETLRKFDGMEMGNIKVLNKLEIELDGKKALIFHGDVFDVIMEHSKWLAKLGAIFYDALILLNLFVNFIYKLIGKQKVSFSKKIKDNVKTAVKFVNNFEETAAEMASKRGFSYVVCGHIHKPENRYIQTASGKKIKYLNSGDWIENLTSLEYHKKKWNIYYFHNDTHLSKISAEKEESDLNIIELDNKELFQKMLAEF